MAPTIPRAAVADGLVLALRRMPDRAAMVIGG